MWNWITVAMVVGCLVAMAIAAAAQPWLLIGLVPLVYFMFRRP